MGGGLALGYFFTPNRLAMKAGSSPEQVWLTSWVSINADNTTTVLLPHVEMGQGVLTSLPMMLAEELEADWSLMDIRQAPVEEIYVTDKLARGMTLGEIAVPRSMRRLLDYSFYKVSGIMNLQITGGSASVRFTGQWGMRVAGAAAKEMLLRAAAERWGVAQSECRARLSRVHHEPSGRALRFADLSEAAAEYSPSLTPPLKSRQDYVICGKPVARVDAPDKVTGAVQYGIDVQLDNMQVGAVRHAPVFGGEVIRYYERNSDPVTSRPGVKDIIQVPGAVVVTADNYWRAQQALDSLVVIFSDGGNDAFNTEKMYADFAAGLDGDNYETDHEQGNGAKAVAPSAEVISADYRVPFLAHATMEPMNCAAHYHDGRLDVWVGTQDPLGTRALAAETAGLDMKNVTVHPLQVGGGFGRRMSFTGNFISDAVQTAIRVPYPVKLVWSRAEDVQHDYYRPAVQSRFKAVLDGNGRPLVWLNRYTDIGVNDGVEAAFTPYPAPHRQIGRVPAQTPAPVTIWRSVEHSYQGFFTESFIDELAARAAQDPLEYRLALLGEQPRHQAVLRLAAEKIGWGKSLPPKIPAWALRWSPASVQSWPRRCRQPLRKAGCGWKKWWPRWTRGKSSTPPSPGTRSRAASSTA